MTLIADRGEMVTTDDDRMRGPEIKAVLQIIDGRGVEIMIGTIGASETIPVTGIEAVAKIPLTLAHAVEGMMAANEARMRRQLRVPKNQRLDIAVLSSRRYEELTMLRSQLSLPKPQPN
jgi:hypothetical protein